MKQIIIGNIPIELEKKKIKNMYLRVLPPDGRVYISAPMRMSEEEITGFVMTKLDWIRVQQDTVRNRHVNQILEYVSGEEIYLWGQKYILTVIESERRSNISIDGDRLILQTKIGSTLLQRTKLLDTWYKEALQKQIPLLIEKWERIIGVKSKSCSIRDMKTRWGTCNVITKNICLNLQLAKKPPKCLEYVVVHELVHLLEKSHNHVFKGYMDRFLPSWRKTKKELNGVE